ncbi:MAG: UDP-N-acetylmuramate dehydrogenase [Alphaproteobacteria bacterium]|nr:UDP-N-acetylmuramate dehydrogenase [Alphaproteobacteria bacterium]
MPKPSKSIASKVGGNELLERLPEVRGLLVENAELGSMTYFRTGGEAEVLFVPEDIDDLATMIAGKPQGVPVTVIGMGANMLVRDGGVMGIVIHLGENFNGITVSENEITCGAGVNTLKIAQVAQKAGLSGLEFLAGMPGSVGGIIRMNAGAFGKEIKDILVGVEVIDASGRPLCLKPDEMDFKYREALIPENWIFSKAVFKVEKDDPEVIAARMKVMKAKRKDTQPIGEKTAGCAFKNPPGLHAWELIDKSGCRGLCQGDAVMSEKHCNFIVNKGKATAEDIETLGETVRRTVMNKTGINLEWEIRRIGFN